MISLDNVKFSLLKFKAGNYWSKTSHRMFWSDNIENIVWENEDLPVKMDILSLPETIKYVIANPGDNKAHRNAIMRIISNRFALKEYVGIENWNNVIFVDLDIIHSKRFGKLDKEQNNLLYENLDYALQNICPNNYLYIEHSSSGIGIHCMFLFDCERTEENYKKFAQYIYEVFMYKIDEYIKDFSSIFTETDGHKVFDDVYLRPYQKIYITGIDYKIHNCDGYCEDINVEIAEEETQKDINIARGTFNIKYITTKKKYDTDYYDRLYIITALKKYVGDYEKCKELWFNICNDFSLYKNYTTNKFKLMFEREWNKIKGETGHIEVLKKYGFKIDETNLHIHLNDNEYIGDVVDDILKFINNGLNLLNSGTGTGKTEVWKKLWNDISDVFYTSNIKTMLIVEPMNSIIDSKYDKSKFEIITGSKKLNVDPVPKCYVTNYNHLIKQTFTGNEPRKDIEKFFGQFDLIIVDESHIMMKDIFRSDVLIPFMQTLNKIKNTKVILQTASPLFEKSVLDIKKTITIHKKEKANVKVIYRQAPDKFNIGQILCLISYYITNKRKVYVYWSAGSLQNMKFIKSIFPETMIIYHKRDKGSDDMQFIDEEHTLGDCNVMISSVYFGVGNDLNDEIDSAAVIIIGNNVWQEDIQAKGRWRNAKNIEMCIITLPNEKEFIEQTKNTPFNWDKRYEHHKYIYQTIYNDKLNRDKSIIIGSKSYIINNREDIDYLAKMQTANEYSSQICIKNEEFKKLGYDVRETFKELQTNKTWEDELKNYRKNLTNIRNSLFKDILEDKFDWDNINKDSSIQKCANILRKLKQKNLIEYCDLKKFIKSKILRYNTFLRYYNSKFVSDNDLAELFSLLWVRNKMNNVNKNDKIDFGNKKLKAFDYYCIYGYLIWLSYRNKDDNKDYINGGYYNIFVNNAYDFCLLEERLINRIFVKNKYNEEYNKFMEKFLGYEIEKEDNITKDNLIEYITRLTLSDEYLNKVMKYLYTYICDKEVKGKIGGKIGSPKKKVVITNTFSKLEKYKLTIGQEFESVNDLAKYANVSRKTVFSWIKSGYVNKKR